jgi:hypothetical protein
VGRVPSAGRRWVGWLAAGTIAALVAVAVGDAVWPRGSSERTEAASVEERLRGAGVPAEQALAGSLSFVDRSGCLLGSVDLTELSVERQALPGGCSVTQRAPEGLSRDGSAGEAGVWLSPAGRWAVAGRADGRASRLFEVSPELVAVRSLGDVRGAVAWSDSSDRVAWCRRDGTTAVLEPGTGRTAAVPGCGPGFAPDGMLLTVVGEADGRGVYAEGELLLGEDALRSALARPQSGPVRPLAADLREDGLLAVVVSAAPRDIYDLLEEQGIDPTEAGGVEAARELLGLSGPSGAMALSGSGTVPRTELQLWRDGRLEAARSLRGVGYPFANRRFGELLEFSPDGGELALGFEGTGVPLALLDVATLDVTLRPTLQSGFAWSPDGAYFALATGAQVTIAGALRSDPAYVLPLAASGLAWRAQ